METRHFWEENGHVKFENYNSNDGFPTRPVGCGDQLNFAATHSDDEADYPANGYLKKGKVARQDPMSHRIIEKRRRDRMNNCLADLSRLIPPEYLKKGRGRVEKTEIIEMAIRHLKYLQERANGLYQETNGKRSYAAERQASVDYEQYKAGYQEAVAEAVRFLVEVQGYGPSDGLCVQMSTHLHRHCDHVVKGEQTQSRRNKLHHAGSSSETTSSSSSTHGFSLKPSVIARADPIGEASRYVEPYEATREQTFNMECDRASVPPTPIGNEDPEAPPPNGTEVLPLDARCKPEATLRTVRKPDHDDYVHSYKFKNSIERRFSRSQDSEVHDMSLRSNNSHGKMYSHKRRRSAKVAPSTSTSNSGSTEDARDTSPQDTSSESTHHHYEKPVPPPTQFVPVFALNSLGKYYVPLSVDYSCLARHLGPYDVLDSRAAHMAAPLHPVTIHVNFQPYINCHVKREEREWRG